MKAIATHDSFERRHTDGDMTSVDEDVRRGGGSLEGVEGAGIERAIVFHWP